MKNERTTYNANAKNRWLAIITVILLLGFFKVAANILWPLAFAIFLIAIFWPLQQRLQKKMRVGFATFLTVLAFFVVVFLFSGTLWYSASLVAEGSSRYASQLEGFFAQLEEYGIPVPSGGSELEDKSDSETILKVLGAGAPTLFFTFFSQTSGLLFVIIYFLLGLLETNDFHNKLNRILSPEKSDYWLERIDDITTQFQNYLLLRSGVGLLIGTLAGVVCWLVGLEFAFIWGLLQFLLNYIPMIGTIIGIAVPTLFALLQFENWNMALLVLLGVGGVQVVISSTIGPLLQGKFLSISPLVILLSVTLWGSLWGVPGSFIAVPLTILIIIACGGFKQTRWIAILLSNIEDDEEREA